jgi:hypothetical protein
VLPLDLREERKITVLWAEDHLRAKGHITKLQGFHRLREENDAAGSGQIDDVAVGSTGVQDFDTCSVSGRAAVVTLKGVIYKIH